MRFDTQMFYFNIMWQTPRVSGYETTCRMPDCYWLIETGWLAILNPFQLYFCHIRMMGGWYWKAVCNGTQLTIRAISASNRNWTWDCKISRPVLNPPRYLGSDCGWMDDLRFYVLFNSISAISGGWDVDNERLYPREPCLRSRRFALSRASTRDR